MNNRNDWHTISAEETAERLNVDPYRGLSEKEVRKRRSKYGRNHIWYVRRMETGKAILDAAGDLSTVLLVITAVLACLFAETAQAVTLCVIAALGAVFRIAAFIKAKRILEENASENIPTAAVLRDGGIRAAAATELVPGDIVLLHPGDTVPCDGRVISEKDALVSEVGITENKESVHKFNTIIKSKPGSAAIPCESRPNVLYAGSTVLEGDPVMIAAATGGDTLVSMKHDGIEIPSGDSLPIIDKLSGWSRISEILMLSLVMVISAVALFTKNNFRLETVFLLAVAVAAASMSEYLTTIGYIIVAITAQSDRKLRAKKVGSGAVIKDARKIESIAAAHRIVLGDISLLKSGKAAIHSFYSEGKIHRGDAVSECSDELGELLSLAAEAGGLSREDSSLSMSSEEAVMRERDQTILQAIELFCGAARQSIRRSGHVIDHLKGGSAIAMGLDLSIVQPADIRKSPYTAAVGDVKSILRCCSTYKTPKGELPLTNEIRKKIFTETVRLEYIGARVIASAVRSAPYLTLTKIPSLLSDMCFMGFFSVSEMSAEGVREAIGEVKAAGGQVVLFSSDPEHDLYYGHDLGLFSKETKVVPYTVSDEVLKEHKSLIVTVPPYTRMNTAADLTAASVRHRVIRHLGGENTAFFTKEALDSRSLAVVDCGIAVSRSGRKAAAQALKNHAGIVVYPNAEEEFGGFAEGLSAMKEARRAMVNMTNVSSYLTVSQLARLFILFAGIAASGLGLALPTPAAILASGLLCDFGAVLAMAFEKAPRDVLSVPCSVLPTFFDRIRKTVLFGFLAGILTAGMPLLMNGLAPLFHVHPLEDREAAALITAALFLTQLSLTAQFMKRDRVLRRGATASFAYMLFSIAVLAVSLLILFEKHIAAIFGGAPVPWYGALLALVPGLILFAVMELLKKNKTK